ncbi:hypothetical protein PGT21_033507 [Puccinia graminis f. sp. tritici]|uniref:Uncharacterized protein n=1 Tax=Puccinia graminis f. sp. tritici TaxID=56615 RepID=A0A5B0MGR8_PUCGR|nr:hypothetical protein PGT21_033507 [Puccinia graminis f. sp. tritici]
MTQIENLRTATPCKVTGQGLCLVGPACSARESDGRTPQAARRCAGCLTTTSPLGDRLLGCTRYLHGGMLAEARRLPPSRDERSRRSMCAISQTGTYQPSLRPCTGPVYGASSLAGRFRLATGQIYRHPHGGLHPG